MDKRHCRSGEWAMNAGPVKSERRCSVELRLESFSCLQFSPPIFSAISVKTLVTRGYLSGAPESHVRLVAACHWPPQGYQFPDNPVKSHSGGGKGSKCPQLRTEQKRSGPCRDQTCPSDTAQFVATVTRRERWHLFIHVCSRLCFSFSTLI